MTTTKNAEPATAWTDDDTAAFRADHPELARLIDHANANAGSASAAVVRRAGWKIRAKRPAKA